MRFGAIDIGSNSIRLLVGELGEGDCWTSTLDTVARAGEPCRLGRGLHETGMVAEELVERAAHLTAEFVRRARSLGAQHVIAAATAALRSARNGEAVAARLGERSGLPVRILSGDDEARLMYRAVVLGLGQRARQSQCVVFDLGGGSTEVVSGVGHQPGRWNSLPFGAVSLTERWLPGDPPTEETIQRAQAHIAEVVMQGCALMPDRTTLLAGVGVTVTVLASIERDLADYDPALLEGLWIDQSRTREIIRRLVTASHVQRRELPIMGEGRADIIGAGALVVEALLDRFQAPGLVCSTQGLRYALVRLAAEEWAAKR
jgi:exopolyphosphatase/guanosine-5'-triphosphate,3'-diphosphate pyrophosphatase